MTILETIFVDHQPLKLFNLTYLRYRYFAHLWTHNGAEMSQDIPAPLNSLVRECPGLVLDIGPGTGELVKRFNSGGITTMYGVEPAANLHKELLKNAQEAGFGEKYHALLCGDEAESLIPTLHRNGILSTIETPGDGIFDEICCLRVLCGVPHLEETIKGLYALLKPGGRMIICEHVVNTWRTEGCIDARVTQSVYSILRWSFFLGGCEMQRHTCKLLREVGEWESFQLQYVEPKSVVPFVVGELIKKLRQLALQYPKSPLHNGSFLIYLTARDQGRGEAALKDIHNDVQLQKAKVLKSGGGESEIKYHQLDITDRRSVESFAAYLKQEHGDGIDFVINNAGIALNGFDANVVQTTLGCNYYDTMRACHMFLPLLKPAGRIVNVASMSGHLNKYTDDVRNRFLTANSESDITSIMKDFASAVQAGKEKEAGFPSAAYAVSKAGLIGATKALARAEEEKGSKIVVNACCPGYVNTDMTKGNGTKSPDEGAQTPVLLALGDIKGATGGFWQHEKPIEW
ncbi:hypothetical protein SLS60_004865 [Paraconiothyrium brasiliense]|uniref:Uncharacterized protein n=1 Tax=Paraconiothyrium brasiliense TaxID=300254 RepID=A0ABR3RLR1_9PLEO